MTDKELKKLKDYLWHSADMLRAGAHLAANKYGQPILGLIFLRYADIKYKQHKDEIMAEFNAKKGTRAERTIKDISVDKCGFYLPEKAYYDWINEQPDNADKATIVKEAMEAIEEANPKMVGVFPKEVYGQLVPEEEPELLSKIIRVFKDIPENCTIDIFGEIYEFFLGKFALAEGKDGGTFYTPASVVQYMVGVLDPKPGEKKFLDPACGSGGMFVQAARYMHEHNATNAELMQFRCYGVEKEPDTVKLAKMNLTLNNVRGEITEANSFYSDPYNAFGAFDYVMANPPFNVDEVVYEKVTNDQRFNTYGVPRNKTKKTTKKESDKKETVPNANYLWIGYFATALNEHGKAALVMANSASDAGGSEYEIRKKMVEEGLISQMVTLPSNMFNSVTLPATLWFFDKQKPLSDKKDEILFIDARNVFTQVDRAHRKFSEEQIKNLHLITKLYNGDTMAFGNLIDEYKSELVNAPETSDDKEIKTKAYWQSQIDWLIERFPDGKYQDVIGLCKVAKLDGEDGIRDQDYSLNAGRYVGVSFEHMKLSPEEFINKNTNLIESFNKLSEEIVDINKTLLAKMKSTLYNEIDNGDGWHIGRVEELGKFKRGKNITSAEMKEGVYPVIAAGMEPSGFHDDFNAKAPCVTVSGSGANAGIVLFHLENIWASDCSFVDDSEYIYYLYDVLHFIQPIITNLQRGSAQPHVYAKDINKLKIIIPPKSTLQQINEMLKVYHTQLNLLQKQVVNTQEQIDLALVRLLSDKPAIN